MTMILGPNGRKLIKSFEELKLVIYLDIRAIPTGGWGHTGFYSTRWEREHGLMVHAPDRLQDGDVVDEARAEIWFDDDTSDAVACVNKLTASIPLTQNQFDALVSFTYNTGIHAFAHSTLLSKLRRAMFSEVPVELLRWDYADHHEVEGLEKRRRAEALLFSTGPAQGIAL